MLPPPAKYLAYLESVQRQFTQQRRSIVAAAVSQPEAFTAEVLFRLTSSAQVTRPAVYRVLKELVESEVLVAHGAGPVTYSLIVENEPR